MPEHDAREPAVIGINPEETAFPRIGSQARDALPKTTQSQLDRIAKEPAGPVHQHLTQANQLDHEQRWELPWRERQG